MRTQWRRIVEMEKMITRRIEKIEDVLTMYNGILDGIQLGSFTENRMLDILELIVSKNTTYYLFEEGTELIGFGGIRENVEVFKVYVMPKYRGQNYGKRISLFLTKKIFDNGQMPICWVKKKNGWNKAMMEMGMVLMEKNSYETNQYRLMDLEAYVEALKKYDIKNIEVKKIVRKVETWEEYHKILGKC